MHPKLPGHTTGSAPRYPKADRMMQPNGVPSSIPAVSPSGSLACTGLQWPS